MALAKYFSKDLLAINRLVNTDHSILNKRLNETVISICFDDNCIHSFEGKCGIDLLVRLLSRLYPRLGIKDLSGKNSSELNNYIALARRINSKIEIVDDDTSADITIFAGETKISNSSDGQILYCGSNNWIANFSLNKPLSFGNSNNPFGAAIASCIVASNVFRHVFKDYLSYTELDSSVSISTYSLGFTEISEENPPLPIIDLKEVALAGVGAIGNGFIWVLSQIENITGTIHLIDEEEVGLTNIQRYVLLEENDEKGIKVDIAKRYLDNTKIKSIPYQSKWDKYLNTTKDWSVKCVAVGIDNILDRIGIQSSLPKVIFNAFTETESLAITRHKDMVNETCLACSYIPVEKQKHYINEVAENCNIPDKAELVKIYYNLDLPVNKKIPNSPHDSLLATIAQANNIPMKDLKMFNGKTLNAFYSDFICGGVILQLSKSDKQIQHVDAPLAFQSAMAGILLAAEIVKYTTNSTLIQEQRTDIYHLSPIKDGLNPFHRMIEKDNTGRCICRDEDFIERYKRKWKK